MQLFSMKLSRVWKQDLYLFWSIECLYLAVMYNQSENPTLHLNLAQKMLEKLIEQGKLKDFQGLFLYLKVLERQGKIQDCLNTLNGPLRQLIKVEKDLREWLIYYHKILQEWDIVQVLSKNMMENERQDWTFYAHYLESIQKTTFLDSHLDFFHRLQTESACECRGPFLAELVLLDKFNANVLDPFLNYIQKFGSLLVCFEDIKPFLYSMSKDELLSKLKRESVQQFESVDDIRMQLTLEKIRFALGEQRRQEWMGFYKYSLPFGENLDKRERQYGDDFILLIVFSLLEEYAVAKSWEPLYQVLDILESSLAKSSFNYHFKILLIRTYILMGVFERPWEVYQSMEIKQIQHDSLSYLICNDLDVFGCFPIIKESLTASKSIYTNNNRETPEMIILAFKNQTFSKIHEFVDFWLKLDNSYQRALTEVHWLRSHWMYQSEIPKSSMDLSRKEKSDNRDLKIFPQWKRGLDLESILFPPQKSQDWIHGYASLLSTVSQTNKEKRIDLEVLDTSDRVLECYKYSLKHCGDLTKLAELLESLKKQVESTQWNSPLERNQFLFDSLQIYFLTCHFWGQDKSVGLKAEILKRIQREMQDADSMTIPKTLLPHEIQTRLKKDWNFTLKSFSDLLE